MSIGQAILLLGIAMGALAMTLFVKYLIGKGWLIVNDSDD